MATNVGASNVTNDTILMATGGRVRITGISVVILVDINTTPNDSGPIKLARRRVWSSATTWHLSQPDWLHGIPYR